MKLTESQLRRIIREELESVALPNADLEAIRGAEVKVIEALKMLPKGFGAFPLVKSAAMALHNARKAMEKGN